MLRTLEQKSDILARLEPTQHISGVVSEAQISELLEVYHTSEKTYKNTGPITVDYFPRRPPYPDWWLRLDEFITEFIGEHSAFSTNFYEVRQPHVLHNDDSVLLAPNLYKTVVIPLEVSKPTQFAVFDQTYLDGPVKLRHGGKFQGKTHDKPKTYYNQDLLSNTVLGGYTDCPFDHQTWQDNFSHMPYDRFHGLTMESLNVWQPGDLIVFDTARIHCGANFLAQGIDYKIGFSIFTSR